MQDKMYVDMEELSEDGIDQDKSHIVEDFLDFQFYKHLSSFSFRFLASNFD